MIRLIRRKFLAICLVLGTVVGPFGCGRACTDLIVDVTKPIRVRECSVVGASGLIVWKFRGGVEQTKQISFGKLPNGAEQLFPLEGARPRDFKLNEKVTVQLFSDDAFYVIRGTAGGPRSFCGHTYESGERKDFERHRRSLN